MADYFSKKRKKEKITSPEQLDSYISVTNPGVWLILGTIVILLTGICIWGVFGRLDTYLPVGAITRNGCTECYLKEGDRDKVQIGTPVIVDGAEYEIVRIAPQPIQVDESFTEYYIHVGGITRGEWVYQLVLNEACAEEGSIHEAQIVVESIAPMYFIIN